MLPTKKPSSLSLVGREALARDDDDLQMDISGEQYATKYKKILPTVTHGEGGPGP